MVISMPRERNRHGQRKAVYGLMRDDKTGPIYLAVEEDDLREVASPDQASYSMSERDMERVAKLVNANWEDFDLTRPGFKVFERTDFNGNMRLMSGHRNLGSDESPTGMNLHVAGLHAFPREVQGDILEWMDSILGQAEDTYEGLNRVGIILLPFSPSAMHEVPSVACALVVDRDWWTQVYAYDIMQALDDGHPRQKALTAWLAKSLPAITSIMGVPVAVSTGHLLGLKMPVKATPREAEAFAAQKVGNLLELAPGYKGKKQPPTDVRAVWADTDSLLLRGALVTFHEANPPTTRGS